jgi:hypothetical protein
MRLAPDWGDLEVSDKRYQLLSAGDGDGGRDRCGRLIDRYIHANEIAVDHPQAAHGHVARSESDAGLAVDEIGADAVTSIIVGSGGERGGRRKKTGPRPTRS